MTIAYKFIRVDENMLWGSGVEHTAPVGREKRRHDYIAAYRSPAAAAFFAGWHAPYGYAFLWECDADVEIEETDKLICTRVTTLRQVPSPTLTPEQRVRIAIRCAQLVCENVDWNAWADEWLSGEDRSTDYAQWVAPEAMACDAARAACEAACGAACEWLGRLAPVAAWTAEREGASMADIHQIIEEEATCMTTKIRRARRAHVCCECGYLIKKQENYQHISGIWASYPVSFKTCLRCRGKSDLNSEGHEDR